MSEQEQPVALPCPKCGALVPIVQPVNGKSLKCHSCGESLKLVRDEGCGSNPGGGIWASVAVAEGVALSSVMLGAYITEQFPEPEDPEPAKRKKKRNLVASITAASLVGLIGALIRG